MYSTPYHRIICQHFSFSEYSKWVLSNKTTSYFTPAVYFHQFFSIEFVCGCPRIFLQFEKYIQLTTKSVNFEKLSIYPPSCISPLYRMSSSKIFADANYKSLLKYIEKQMMALRLEEAKTDDQTFCSSLSPSGCAVEEKSSENSFEDAKEDQASCSSGSLGYYVKEKSLKNDSQKEPEYKFPTPILMDDLIKGYQCYKLVDKKSYNFGIIGLGVSNTLSAIAYFCRFEARNKGFDVVSVGSDDGFFDQEIIENYRWHFAPEELEITSVNAHPNPKRDIEFKTVDELVKRRPSIVSNCVLLLVWPEFAMSEEATETELDVIRILQPHQVLIVFEVGGMCGSADFHAFLRKDVQHPGWARYGGKGHGVDNYSLFCISRQVVNFNDVDMEIPALDFRMIRLQQRLDRNKKGPVNSAPATDEGLDVSLALEEFQLDCAFGSLKYEYTYPSVK